MYVFSYYEYKFCQSCVYNTIKGENINRFHGYIIYNNILCGNSPHTHTDRLRNLGPQVVMYTHACIAERVFMNTMSSHCGSI